MAELLLDRIHGEIRERLRASEAAMREYERLQAALSALGQLEPYRQAQRLGQGLRRGPRGLGDAPSVRLAAPRPERRVARTGPRC
jgi:hypothetical protein